MTKDKLSLAKLVELVQQITRQTVRRICSAQRVCPGHARFGLATKAKKTSQRQCPQVDLDPAGQPPSSASINFPQAFAGHPMSTRKAPGSPQITGLQSTKGERGTRDPGVESGDGQPEMSRKVAETAHRSYPESHFRSGGLAQNK